jgi:YesN/AraC family two-component response regulator
VCGEAENGQEVIQKAHHLKPDLVLMDFSMPIMNGLDAASHLKKAESESSDRDAHHV